MLELIVKLCFCKNEAIFKRRVFNILNVTTKKMGISALVMIIILAVSMVALVGCDNQEQTLPAEATSLTEDELSYFNGDLFFNGDYLNIHNQFLSSLYDEPADIDLFQLFYCGSGIAETITEDELKAVMVKNEMTGRIDDLPCPCEKISRLNMDEILTKCMGITLTDTNEIGLDHFTYLSQYDAYYYFHGDTNYRGNINFSSGEREGNVVRLFYNDGFVSDGDKALTLQEKNGEYLFIANQKVEL